MCDKVKGVSTMIKRYVLGFYFREEEVLLVRKSSPPWQKGRWNGVGGHVEVGETPQQAMRRAFKEEAGFDPKARWEFVGYLKDKGDTPENIGRVYLYLYRAFRHIEDESPNSSTDVGDPLVFHSVFDLPCGVLPCGVLSNLRWLTRLLW